MDVFALMGDSVDNVPGVPGIGEKTAVELITRFGTLESLYGNVDQVRGPKRRESIRTNREQAFRSRELVTIRRDVPLEMTDGLFSPPRPDRERLLRLYRDLEFRSLTRELEADLAASGVREEPGTQEAADYEIVRDKAGRTGKIFRCRRHGFMPQYLKHAVADERDWEEDVAPLLDPATPERWAGLQDRMREVEAAGPILTRYMEDKLNQPVAGLSQTQLASLLPAKGVDEDLTRRVQNCLMLSEMGRYAPAELTLKQGDLWTETAAVIDELDKSL